MSPEKVDSALFWPLYNVAGLVQYVTIKTSKIYFISLKIRMGLDVYPFCDLYRNLVTAFVGNIPKMLQQVTKLR